MSQSNLVFHLHRWNNGSGNVTFNKDCGWTTHRMKLVW